MGVNVLIFTEAEIIHELFARTQGAYRIATEIRLAGYTCQTIDMASKFTLSELYTIVDKFVDKDTLAICFSNTFFSVCTEKLDIKDTFNVKAKKYFENVYMNSQDIIFKFINYAKSKNKTLKTIVGGAKSYNIDLKNHPEIDVLVLSYGDEVIIDILKKIEIEKDTIASNQMVINGYPKTPFRSFDFRKSKTVYQQNDFIDHGKESLTLEISRGCKFNCKFCAFQMNGRRGSFLQYTKDADILYEELMENYNNFGITSYLLCEDTFNESEEKLDYIGNVFKKLPFDIKFGAWLRHDLIYHHRDMAHKLRDMGIIAPMFGIETFSDSAGKIVGKGLGKDKTKELLHWLKHDVWKKDIHTYSGFIIGLPTESPELAKQNITEYVLSDDCNLDSFITTPLRITPQSIQMSTEFNRVSEFDRNAEKYGFKFTPDSYLDWKKDDYTFNDAFLVSEELNTLSNSISKITGMVLIQLIGMGYSKDYVLNLKKKNFYKTFNSTNILLDKSQRYKLKVLQ